jgi:hypothetical protein
VVLRRPLESAQFAAREYRKRLQQVPSRGVLEMAVAVSGTVTVSRQAARSIMLLAGG